MSVDAQYWECPQCGYLLFKTKTAGDEGNCPLAHDRPYALVSKGPITLGT